METLNSIPSEDPGLRRQAPIVLLIEDEAIVAADIRARLTALGYSVPAIAASAEEA
ncbi:MAG: hypothetical protein H6Q85_778, partial [candidate division NC10 bacterium]|nr:hypothetical protein [candidate division NC10 bacterium]